MEDRSSVWLTGPTSTDDSYANRGEHTLDWLARSTLPRAKECRRFLNDNLALLPEDMQEALHKALRHRWHSAFFELLVARILQELGAALTAEAENSTTGRRPDFT